MGWASRTGHHGRPNRAWGWRPSGIRLVCCVNCGEYDGTLKKAFVKEGKQFYVHDMQVQHRANRRCRERFRDRADAEATIAKFRVLAGASGTVDTKGDQAAANGDRGASGDASGGD